MPSPGWPFQSIMQTEAAHGPEPQSIAVAGELLIAATGDGDAAMDDCVALGELIATTGDADAALGTIEL